MDDRDRDDMNAAGNEAEALGATEGVARHAQGGRPASDADAAYMRQAIELARGGAGWTNPNPLVGAVIVKDGRVIGQGFHERIGDLHAERNALRSCTEDPAGATIYVTLEPCDHTGRQPPCTEALIAAHVARVVVGSRDPNPLVSGRGVEHLRRAGIEVDIDVLRDECDRLNPIFFHYITSRRPFVLAKWAMTLDGKVATSTGDARWVTGEAARAEVHEMRHRLAAIMVGIGTVLADDPLLTARRAIPSNQPTRIVCDSQLSIPLESQLVRTAREVPTIIACACDPTAGDVAGKAAALTETGVEVVSMPTSASPMPTAAPAPDAGAGDDGAAAASTKPTVDLTALMVELGRREIDSVLVEGGPTLMAALLADGLADEVVAYVAPKVVGGRLAPSAVGGAGVDRMAGALELGAPEVGLAGEDVRLTYRPYLQRKGGVR